MPSHDVFQFEKKTKGDQQTTDSKELLSARAKAREIIKEINPANITSKRDLENKLKKCLSPEERLGNIMFHL